MISRLNVSESETNNAMKFINVKIRIVHIMFTSDTTWDPIADQTSFDALQINHRIQRLR
jgi:hypothetical protein